MKHIIKGESPDAFESWKAENQFTSWSSFLGTLPPENKREEDVTYYSKDELREVLWEEQEENCCYCEKRIPNNHKATRIDHIEPREGDTQTERIFDYYNLLLSCDGGENIDEDEDEEKKKKEKDRANGKKPKRILHCDTEKRNEYLKISPLDERCETEITFTLAGKILGLTEDAKQAISILNLDIVKLNNAREEAISGYIFNIDETLISIEECNALIINLQQTKKLPFKTAILKALHQLKSA